ncbi:Regulator of chromosome condensation, RCC1 [Dillenia turbinata]|uniref:Regulator of chromosome condensation, RCC1 n=1 Tax=Dillenia turbinata TaxID=194707 RepID=A0AAN8Z0H3_9MAGN
MASLLLRRCYCSRSASFVRSSKIAPLLWKSSSEEDDQNVTVQLLSWGRGASGQLGGGIEEIRLYPTPVCSLLLPPSFRLSSPISGRLCDADPVGAVEVGISCGLFHSSLLVDGKLWIWGKGDGGRLGFGHENSVFEPTVNPNFDCGLKSVALGGVHSVALTSAGQVFTWGYGGFGALGHSVYHRELFPRLVEGPWDGTIRHVATSGTHTAAINESGILFPVHYFGFKYKDFLTFTEEPSMEIHCQDMLN